MTDEWDPVAVLAAAIEVAGQPKEDARAAAQFAVDALREGHFVLDYQGGPALVGGFIATPPDPVPLAPGLSTAVRAIATGSVLHPDGTWD